MPLFGMVRSIADGVAGAAGAAFASQMPEFVQQYLQRLGGHRDEALRAVAALKGQGRSVSDALLASSTERAASLTRAYDAIASAGEFMRPAAFVQNMDPEIARAAWALFRPAVPLTPAGLLYAGIGLVLAIALLHLVAAPFAWLWRRRYA